MLRSLTALRFPAALAVFLVHAPLTRPGAVALSSGYVGVGFFFLLSGFILTFNYSEPFSLRRFYTARFARIYPVHLFAMIVAIAVLVFAGGGPEWRDAPWNERSLAIALQSVLLQSWFSSAHIHFGANGPSWSLSDEAFFYALFPFALAAIVRVFRRSEWTTLLLAAAATWALLFAILARIGAPYDDWAVYIFPPVRFVDFAVGMLLGSAFLRMPSQRPWKDATFTEVCTLCAFTLAVALTAHLPQSLRFSAAMMPFSGAVVFVFALQCGWISRALASKTAVRLGEASYAFYLLHRPVIGLTTALLPARPDVAFACSLAVSIALSLTLFVYLETPLRRLIRERLVPRDLTKDRGVRPDTPHTVQPLGGEPQPDCT